MINILEKFYSKVMPIREDFNNNKAVSYLPFILAVITTQILLLLLGKFLWNNYLVRTVTIIKPIESIFEILALSLLFNLIF